MNWNNHPRPQMKRENYLILKNNWMLNDEKIQMPFPPQSPLSEYGKEVEDILEYTTEFGVPKTFEQERVLLHFGAVDQIARVWINGKEIGGNEGGYLPFSFDITDVVDRGKINLLRVEVTDTLSHKYPYGKQKKNFNCKFKRQKYLTFTLTIVRLLLQIFVIYDNTYKLSDQKGADL